MDALFTIIFLLILVLLWFACFAVGIAVIKWLLKRFS
jgi:hypothetical protein